MALDDRFFGKRAYNYYGSPLLGGISTGSPVLIGKDELVPNSNDYSRKFGDISETPIVAGGQVYMPNMIVQFNYKGLTDVSFLNKFPMVVTRMLSMNSSNNTHHKQLSDCIFEFNHLVNFFKTMCVQVKHEMAISYKEFCRMEFYFNSNFSIVEHNIEYPNFDIFSLFGIISNNLFLTQWANSLDGIISPFVNLRKDNIQKMNRNKFPEFKVIPPELKTLLVFKAELLSCMLSKTQTFGKIMKNIMEYYVRIMHYQILLKI